MTLTTIIKTHLVKYVRVNLISVVYVCNLLGTLSAIASAVCVDIWNQSIRINILSNFKTVSFRTQALTRNQQQNFNNQQKAKRLFSNGHLTSFVDSVVTKQRAFVEQGGRPQKQWSIVFEQSGTPYLGDAFFLNIGDL